MQQTTAYAIIALQAAALCLATVLLGTAIASYRRLAAHPAEAQTALTRQITQRSLLAVALTLLVIALAWYTSVTPLDDIPMPLRAGGLAAMSDLPAPPPATPPAHATPDSSLAARSGPLPRR